MKNYLMEEAAVEKGGDMETMKFEGEGKIESSVVEANENNKEDKKEELFSQEELKEILEESKLEEIDIIKEVEPATENENRPSNSSFERRTPKILSIDGKLAVETKSKKRAETRIALSTSQKTRTPLTGEIDMIDENSFGVVACVTYKEATVYIPANEIRKTREPDDVDEKGQPVYFNPNNPNRRYTKNQYENIIIKKFLGAEIDFIIKEVVEESGSFIAVASRLEAMEYLREKFYLEGKKHGNERVREGMIVEARVVLVTKKTLTIEIFGVETNIPVEEATYLRATDLSVDFSPGQRVLAKILSIVVDEETNDIEIRASIKQAQPNVRKEKIEKLKIGSNIKGVVSYVSDKGIYVKINDYCDCFCLYPKDGKNPLVGDIVIIKPFTIDVEKEFVRARIVKIFSSR
ncbi:MAG: hypothetical protein ACRCU3_02715 [Eubacteriaceae bacterium]